MKTWILVRDVVELNPSCSNFFLISIILYYLAKSQFTPILTFLQKVKSPALSVGFLEELHEKDDKG